LVAALATLFFLLLGDIMGLNILHYLNITENPGYSYSNVDQEITTANKVAFGLTAAVVIAYFIFYLVAVIVNCKYIRKSAFS
jgi:hypothetical protein